MSKVNIGIPLDLEQLISTRLLIQANSGGGKSYAIRKILEETHGKVQQIVIDPEGEFASLREHYDYVLIGKSGDIKINMRHVETLALKLLEYKITCIIDLSGLLREEKVRFVKLFLNAMINSPKELWHQVLVPIDEIHKFCPQTQKGAKTSVESRSAVIEFLDSGRKRGFCAILATQRISKLDKDAAAECANKLIGRTGLTNDMRTVADELGMNKTEMLELRQLEAGEFFCFGPALSNEVKKFKITLTKSTHPKAGQKLNYVPPTTDTVKKELAKLADIPEEAEKELKTTADLKAEVTKLRSENTRLLHAKPAPIIDDKAIERAINAKEVELTKKYNHWLQEFNKKIEKYEAEVKKAISGLTAIVPVELPKLEAVTSTRNILSQTQNTKADNQYYETSSKIVNRTAPLLSEVASDTDIKLNKKQQEILNALAWYESLGNFSPTNQQVGAVALIDPTGGYFSNMTGPLTTNELIIRSGGTISLTEKGRALAQPIEQAASLDEYHNVLRSRIRKMKSSGGKTIEMLNELISAGTDGLTTEELGQRISIDHTGGYFSNMIGPLSTAGFIKRNNGRVIPTEILFPEGLY